MGQKTIIDKFYKECFDCPLVKKDIEMRYGPNRNTTFLDSLPKSIFHSDFARNQSRDFDHSITKSVSLQEAKILEKMSNMPQNKKLSRNESFGGFICHAESGHEDDMMQFPNKYDAPLSVRGMK